MLEHENAMDETPKEIVKLIFSKFPYGVSINQLKIIMDEANELLKREPLCIKEYD